MWRLPAHLDTCDPNATGEPRGGAGKGKSEDERREPADSADDRDPLPEKATLSARLTTPRGLDQGGIAPCGQGREV